LTNLCISAQSLIDTATAEYFAAHEMEMAADWEAQKHGTLQSLTPELLASVPIAKAVSWAAKGAFGAVASWWSKDAAATVATDAAAAGSRGPSFIVSKGGTAFPVPRGASGPFPTESGKGFQFIGGSGGNGLSPRATSFRFMDPVTTGKYHYPGGYGSYGNGVQTINPFTGQTIAPSNPWWHIPAQ